jgi:hypothetical protein
MAYSQTNFEEALALRKEGKDDASIRMILASKRLPSAQIDAIFSALDKALPRKKAKNIAGIDDEGRKKIEKRDFYILIAALIGIGGIVWFMGEYTEIGLFSYLGGASTLLGLWALGRTVREYNFEQSRRDRDE